MNTLIKTLAIHGATAAHLRTSLAVSGTNAGNSPLQPDLLAQAPLEGPATPEPLSPLQKEPRVERFIFCDTTCKIAKLSAKFDDALEEQSNVLKGEIHEQQGEITELRRLINAQN